jgi:hypothetical protein
MEFLGGNDFSGIASIGPIIYLTFLQFHPMQLILLSQLLLGRNSAGVCLKCRVCGQPYQNAVCDNNT